ncbi:hypothetical protein JOM56_013082 [Amanita muscaria]
MDFDVFLKSFDTFEYFGNLPNPFTFGSFATFDRNAEKVACEALHRVYAREIKDLVKPSAGWNFSAQRATPEDIDEFDLEDLASDVADNAPRLWALLDILLLAKNKQPVNSSGNVTMACTGDAETDDDDDAALQGAVRTPPTSPEQENEKKSNRRLALHKIKKTVIVSIFMQSTKKVIETLAHMGISISMTAIYDAIKSLSINARRALQDLGRTMSFAIAYDNVDVLLKTSVPTVEKTTENLRHLTSGLFFPLMHGVQCEDLKCSKELWEKSLFNPYNVDVLLDKKTYSDLVILLTDKLDEDKLTARDHFVAWLFLRDLCTYGPVYFQKLLNDIGEPEALEAIPLVKTKILPAYTMEVNNSTTSGNIQAIDNLLEQAGILDPDKISDDEHDLDFDVTDYILPFHGDLGTGERIHSIHQCRSIEDEPYHRKQHVLFCPGLFHCKMACTDTLHRVLVKPEAARKDASCMMNEINILRPKETHVMTTKPGFRRMHQSITHIGICRRLDCWRVLAQKMNPDHTSLECFASSQPTVEYLKKMANTLALDFTSNEDLPLSRLNPTSERDQLFENATLVLKYLALYEELSWAMNHGDIARVERCLLPWIALFKATGKHKYATHLTRFLTTVHFELSERTQHAIRYNWLINVTGKPGKFRAVDWYVELHNMRIKVRFLRMSV